MHFEIEVWDDQTASGMKDVIRDFASKDHTRMGAFVCCVLSHGEKGKVFGVDGKEVEIHELTGPIAECPTLASKPKLFFIQACQGNERQNGVLAADAPGNATEEDPYDEDAHNPAARVIPIEADMLIGMATVERYQSYRHTKDGSIYIQELCYQLEEFCPRWVQEETLSCLEWKMNVGILGVCINSCSSSIWWLRMTMWCGKDGRVYFAVNLLVSTCQPIEHFDPCVQNIFYTSKVWGQVIHLLI